MLGRQALPVEQRAQLLGLFEIFCSGVSVNLELILGFLQLKTNTPHHMSETWKDRGPDWHVFHLSTALMYLITKSSNNRRFVILLSTYSNQFIHFQANKKPHCHYFECAVSEFFSSFHSQPVRLRKTNAVLDEYLTKWKAWLLWIKIKLLLLTKDLVTWTQIPQMFLGSFKKNNGVEHGKNWSGGREDWKWCKSSLLMYEILKKLKEKQWSKLVKIKFILNGINYCLGKL